LKRAATTLCSTVSTPFLKSIKDKTVGIGVLIGTAMSPAKSHTAEIGAAAVVGILLSLHQGWCSREVGVTTGPKDRA
jgi:hypothetical protein